jgi:FKBP-type peptidyl-prolyl cis-trans isomerase
MSIFTLKSTKKANFFSILTIFALIFIISTQLGCSKSGNSSSVNERDQMIDYAKANSITYTEDSTGILYEITNPGTGTKPNINSTITVTYKGKLLNGTQFDAGTITYPLSSLIQGWQIAVPKIAAGGSMKVLIPSNLGYGAQGAGSSIPPYSPLYFEISLSSFR